jgi:hypothetical protein
MSAQPLTVRGRASIAALAVGLCVGRARADDLAPPKVSFRGFGTLGLAHSSESQGDFTSTIFKQSGAGYTHAWSADVDSLAGVQVTARPISKLSLVLQVVSEQRPDGAYWPHVEWANVKYQFTPDFSLRVGRTIVPIFMVADSRKIAYANLWVRPPLEVYSLNPVTQDDGVDASYRARIGAWTNTFQVTAGRSNSGFPPGGGFGAGTLKARGLVAVVDAVEKGFATVRLSFGRTSLTIPEFGPLFDGFRQFGPEGAAIANKYGLNKRLVTLLGVGASYDPGRWFGMGEWGRIDTRSVLGVKTGWYVSGGYRFRKTFTVYVTYADVKADGKTSDPGLTAETLPSPLFETALVLNGALNSFLGAKVVQSTISTGGRWDFTKNATFKLQLDHTRHGEDSAGTLANLQPAFARGQKVTVFSASIDFVF